MSDSRPSFNMTRDQINHFPIIFTKNIQEFRKNPDNKDEGATLFHLEKTRSTVLDLLVDSNINKVNERLNKAWPKEAVVIQQTINDINSIIENEDPNIKITREFQEMVNYIEKESQDHWGKSLFISSAIQILESYISTNNNFKSLWVWDAKEIDKELSKDIKLLELIQLFYKDYLETNPLQTNDNTWEKEMESSLSLVKNQKQKIRIESLEIYNTKMIQSI